MSEFLPYRRTQIAEMRPVTKEEIELGRLIVTKTRSRKAISVSEVDLQNGSPKIGDMIARNPKNHDDQSLVAKEYFEENFEPLYTSGIDPIIQKQNPKNSDKNISEFHRKTY